MKTLSLLHKIFAIIVLILIFYVIIVKGNLFIFLGALGGCLFLIKLVLESAFPEWFEDEKRKENEIKRTKRRI